MATAILTLCDARKIGAVHYFTGEPCSSGHVAPRYVSGRQCVKCMASPRVYAERRRRQAILRSGTWVSTQVANARKRAILHRVDIDEAEVRLVLSCCPDRCPVLGTDFVMTGKQSALSPSLDRIRPDRGYVAGNMAVISVRANVIKNDATAAELRAVADWLDSVTN